MNNFTTLETNLVKFGYVKKYFGGIGIYPYVLVNYNTDISIGIKDNGKFFVAPDSPNHYQFESINEVINFISK